MNRKLSKKRTHRIQVRLERDLVERAKRAAWLDNRTLSSWVELHLEKAVNRVGEL